MSNQNPILYFTPLMAKKRQKSNGPTQREIENEHSKFYKDLCLNIQKQAVEEGVYSIKTLIVSARPSSSHSVMRRQWNLIMRKLAVREGATLGSVRRKMTEEITLYKAVRFSTESYNSHSLVNVFFMSLPEIRAVALSDDEKMTIIYVPEGKA